MKKHPDDGESTDFKMREKLIGFGEKSIRKSYYPELQKKLEELERFRTLLDYSNDSIFVIDPKSGNIFDVNKKACKMLQFTRDELLKQNIINLEQYYSQYQNWNIFYHTIQEKKKFCLKVI